MTRIHTILLASLALVLALGVCLPQAVAETPQFHAFTIARIPEMPQAIPAATIPGVMQGVTAMGPNPPTNGPPPSWPCFPTAAPCSADPAGGMLAALPEEVFSLSACQNTSTGCGQLWWTFEMGSATGNIIASLKITQKVGTTTNTLFSIPPTNLGPAPAAGFIEVIYVTGTGLGPSFCSGCVAPVAGTATAAVTTMIKGTTTVTAKGSFNLTLQ